MGKSLSLLLFLFTALMGFSQTTVTLQDQCNCEVLRGTDVSSPGATMPTGADTGDIYVNTTSGTIFYWDGDSWELTATDDQQLTGFTFNDATNQLTLDLENGGSVNVDLSSLSDTFSDTNTTITSFDIDSGTNSLVITDSDTNTFSVALAAIAAIVDTDNQDATEVALNGALDVDGDGNDETTVQEAIADLAAITETVTNLVDNNDGTITYTNEDGTPQTINKSDLTDNGNGTFTFDNGDGAAITFVGTDDQDATEVALNGVLDVDGDGNDETTVQEAIADLAAITETVTNLIDNNDGTITYTNEDGTPQTINKSDLTDNGNGTFTFDNDDGAPITFVGTDDQDATEVALNGVLDVDGDGNDETTVQEAIADLAAITETVTNLIDNNDGTITYTNEDGTPQTINKSDLTDNGNGTFTFDNDDGAPITFVGTDDQDATEVALNGVLDVDGDGNDETTVQEAIADLAAITETVTNLIDNNDGTITYTNEDGNPQTINKSDLTDNGNGTFTFDNGDGAPITFVGTDDQDATGVDFTATGNTTSTNVQDAIEEIQTELDGVDGTDDQDLGIGTNGVANESVEVTITDGAAALIDIRDGDADAANEINTAFAVVGTNLRITDSGGSLQVPLTSLGSDNQDLSHTILVPEEQVRIEITDGNNTTISIEDADADITNELTTSGTGAPSGAPANNNTGVTYVDTAAGQLYMWDGTTWNIVGGSATPGDASDTNELITSFSVTNDGTEDVLRITEAGSDFDVPLSNIGTDDQTATEVTVADAGDNFTTDTVEAALAELAGRTDNDTQYTAGNGLNLDGSNEFTAVASPDANNALDVRANGIYATDDQNAGEVTVADAGDNFTVDTVEAALAELAGRTDNDTQYTAGNGLNLDGSNEFTAVASPDANNALDVRANGIYATDDQDLGIGTNGVANESVEVTITNGTAALIDIRDGDSDDTNELTLRGTGGPTGTPAEGTTYVDTASGQLYVFDSGAWAPVGGSATPGDASDTNELITAFGINGTDLRITEAGNNFDVPLSSLGSDDQNAGEVTVADAGDNFTTDTVEAALAELAGRTDNDTQYTAGNGLNLDGSNEFTAVASPDANNALDVRANGIYAADDQSAGEVAVADAGDNFTTDTVEAALAELAGRTDNDTQYTAGNGLNLDGSNEFTAVASSDANNALDVRANGIYATDDQNAGEVTVADTGDNFTVDTVEAALAELAGRTDNDTQYTAGNGLNLDGSNEFTAVASPDANNALDVRANGIYATDDQTATEVTVADAGDNFTTDTVEAALAELAGRTDNDTQYTAGNGLNLDGSNEFTAVASPDANNALDVRANGIYATDDQDLGIGANGVANESVEVTITNGTAALIDIRDGDSDDTNELTLRGTGGPTGTPAEGTTYVDTASGQLYVFDSGAWAPVGGSATPGDASDTNELITSFSVTNNGTEDVLRITEAGSDFDVPLSNIGTDDQNAGEVAVADAGDNFTTDTVEAALAELAGRTDNDTQYTAGNGLNLDGSNEFTAVASPDANNALDVRANGIYATDTDDQTAGEVAVADAGDNFTTDTVEAALAELAGRTDNDTQYTAGNGLNLDGSNEFTAVASPDANNALDVRANGIYATDTDDQTAGEVAVADAGDNFTTDTVEAALAELAGRTDNDTQYTAGNGLNLDGSNEFTAVASPDANNALDVRANGIYATDDQTATEVAVTDAGDNFTVDTVEAALAELAGRTDNDTQYTAGNGLNLDGSNEFTAVASPDANNALDVRANGIYATDDQNAGEVTVADAGDNFTVDTVEAALAELAGRTDNDTQYTAGNGLNLDGSNEFTAVASPDANNALDVRANGIYATDTDDQTATEVAVADAGDNFTVDTVEAALAELAGRTDNDTQYTAGNGLNLDGSNEFTADISTTVGNALIVDANGLYVPDTDNDTQYTAGNGLNLDGSNEFTAVASPDANNALDVRTNGIYATDTDDQTATEVTVADAGDNFTVDTVEAALAELAGRTDNDTQYTAGSGLNLDGSNEFTADISTTVGNALIVDANGLYVPDTDNDTQYTAGNGLNLDGSNEFTAVASPDANNALDVRTNGIYATDTDDQTAGEVAVADAGDNFTTDTVEAALAELAGRTDNDTQYTAGNGLNLDGSNEFTAVASPDANNALDVRANGIYATDDQNAGEVTVADAGDNFTVDTVEAALAELAGRTDNDTQYTAGNGLNLDGSNEFTAVASPDANNALDVRANGIYATDDQEGTEVNLTAPIDIDGDTTIDYTTVEQVIQDVAPVIPAIKAARVFYPPSIAIDASANGTFTINLYAQYIAQFGSPVASSGGTIPVYADDELDYHVTFADPSVFGAMSISTTGELTYTIVGQPADYNSLINVVFVVK